MAEKTIERLIRVEESFQGSRVSLRLVTLADCTERYLSWLNNADVSKYLETRWVPQSLQTIREFVSGMICSANSYLFAIVENASGQHIGNIKIGPIHHRHNYADVSYFIGDPGMWGRGYASEAIELATRIGFERLDVHRLQAGLYDGNAASGRALEKAGYLLEGRLMKQLLGVNGWEDHLWYGIVRAEP